VQTQQGTGSDDGNYRHSSTPKGELLRFAQDKKEDQNGKVWFADLVGIMRSILIHQTNQSLERRWPRRIYLV